MEPTAPTAPENKPAEIPPTPPPAPPKEDGTNPNALDTEMSDEEMAKFVDQTLGIHSKTPQKPTDKPADNKTDEEKAAAEKAEADKKAAEEKAAAEKGKTEETEEEKTAREAKEAEDKKAADAKKTEKAETVEPEEVKPVEIPDVKTDDLWIEVEALVDDGEGNTEPKTIKLTVDGELPDNVKFKNDKQLYEVVDAVNEMRALLKQRQAEHDEAVAKQEEQKSAAETEKATLAGWDAEIQQLIENGLLEENKVKPGEDGFNEDPTIVKIDQVFKFMSAENEKRMADGKTPIKSFTTAFTLWNKTQEAEEKAKADEEAKKKEKEEAELKKKRGALVGGGSGGAGTGDKAPVYKRGSAKSIYQVDTSDL